MQLHSTEHAPAHAIPSAEMFPMLSPVAAETQAAPLSPVGSLPVCTDGARTHLCAPPAAPRIDPQTCLYPVVPLPPQTLPVWGGSVHSIQPIKGPIHRALELFPKSARWWDWAATPALSAGSCEGRSRREEREAQSRAVRLKVAGKPVLGETSVLGALLEPSRHSPCPGPSPHQLGEPCVLSRWLLLTLFAHF